MNRGEFFHLLDKRTPGETADLQVAYWFSKNVHFQTRPRDNGERYFEHPRRVAANLLRHGHQETKLIIAAFLHDVVEDTLTPASVIVSLFGADTWERLFLLSKKMPVLDPATGQVIDLIEKEVDEYFSDIRTKGDRFAKLIKLADRLDNITDCGCWAEERKRRYIDETRRYVQPMADETDQTYAAEIRAATDALEASLTA
jgi:guanosine-3',5'-bis(diphosphate) 3'-pyrophosphohydrolase